MSNQTLAQVRIAALNLLAMREHSMQELHEKLVSKFDSELVDDCLDTLQQQGLQSDERFAEAFVRMRHRQGKGPQRITQELKRKGIIGDVISSSMLEGEDWNQLAASARIKKFGDELPKDPKEKAKQMRFLAARGFLSSNIHYALTKK